MTIRLRILALLSLLCLFCIGTTWYFKRLHEDEETFGRQQRVKAMASRLQRLIGATAQPTYRYLHDFSSRDGLVEFIAKHDPEWADKNIKGMLDLYRIDQIWVLDAGGAMIYGRDRTTGSVLAAPPLPAEELQPLLQNKGPFDFHAFIGGKLFQLQGRPIIPDPAPNGPAAPAGWLIVAQHWGELRLHDLADSAEGYIALTGPTHVSDVRGEEELETWQPLRDRRGNVIAGLDYHVIDSLMEDPALEKIELALFVYNSVGAVLLVAVLMHLWILRPFSLVSRSLAARDPSPLAPLLSQQNEFGQMARSAQSSLHDREQLQQSLDERMRLGRELHDGAIQSLFGTGMAISRVQSLMTKDLPAAHKLLDETKAELNRVILDLRNHVDKADPKPLDSTFGEAVARLIQQLHGPEPVATELSIDEALVAGYALMQRSQALQFVREAISNALRHGRPSRLAVSWQRSTEGSLLLVADDGAGFDPEAVKPGGRGLGNLGERAISLGGRLEVASSPKQGTKISLKLPTPKGSV